MAPQVTWGHGLCFLPTKACAWTLPSVERACQSSQSLFPRYLDTMSSLYLLFEQITFFSKIIVFQSSLYWSLILCYDKISPSRQLIKEWICFSLQSQVRFQHNGGVSMAASIRSGYWSRNLRVHTLNHNCKSKREKKNHWMLVRVFTSKARFQWRISSSKAIRSKPPHTVATSGITCSKARAYG